MVYIGIDPGMSGSLAYMSDSMVRIIPFDETAYVQTLTTLSLAGTENIRCCLERVSAMPGQGVTSMFNFGKNFGWITGVLDTLGIPYELVTPQRWKKEFGVTAEKNSSVSVCKRLFPTVCLLPNERCRKDNDGMAEALLMAEYARRKM